MSRRLVERLVVCLSVFPALPVLPVLAQTDPRLVDVIRHAQEGRSDSARLQVQRLLATTSPTDTLYPQIVYTQAMVANDASDMRRQLQRVAVEYPSSSWADDALLRLVQLDYASANLDGAARNLERIRLDYPDSPLIPQTAYWAARTYFDQKKPETACRWVREGLSVSTGNIELQNQLRYLNQRCAQFAAAPDQQRGDTQTSSPPPADSQRPIVTILPDTGARTNVTADTTGRAPSGASSPPVRSAPARAQAESVTTATPRPAGLRYRIQITAVRSAATAQSLSSRLRSKGFNPVTVEEGGLYKVRVGDYATKAEAASAVPEIKAKLGGSPFVVAGS
jgi:cell division septation protein DedD